MSSTLPDFLASSGVTQDVINILEGEECIFLCY